jgi:outer membrane receptor protein involved in Fe transport
MERLTLDWTPIDKLKVEMSLTGDRDHSDTQAPQYIYSPLDIYSSAALAAADANAATRNPYGIVNNALYAGLTTPGSSNYDATLLGRQTTVVGRLNNTNPAAASARAGAAAVLGTPDVVGNARAADWTQGLLRPADNDYFQGTLRIDYDILDDLTLTSVSAYAHKTLNYAVDDDGTAAQVVDIPVFGSVRAVDEELRLSGKSEKWNWMIGGDYDESLSVEDNYYGLSDYSANQPIPSVAPITLGENNFQTKLKTYAAFTNLEYTFTRNLSANAGVRFTQNNQTAAYCYNDPAKDTAQTEAGTFSVLQDLFTGLTLPPIGPGQCFVLGDGKNGTTFGRSTITPLERSQDQNNVSYRAGLNYKFDQGTLVYATVSRGYKAGVFSDIGAASTSQYAPAVQEKVIAYETGVKASLFDHKLQLNGAYFYYAYTDKQVRGKILDPIFGLNDKMINIPKSYVWGLEGELQARPIYGLTLSASATYLKSEVTSSFTRTIDGIPAYNANQYTGNFKGSPLPYTPEFSANADVQYEWRVGQNLAPIIGGNVLYEGSQNTTYANAVLLAGPFHIDGYTTVDFRLGIGSTDGRWQVTVFDRNAFNRAYTTSVTTFLDTVFRLTGMPSTYGVSARLRF